MACKIAMRVPEIVVQFSTLMNASTTSTDTTASLIWSEMKVKIYDSTLEAFGKKTHKSKEWFEENIATLLSLVERKRQAHVEHQHELSPTTLSNLCKAQKAFRRSTS